MRLISTVVLALACVATLGCDQDLPTAPTPTISDLTGTWTGIGTYPNAPFRFVLTQTGTTLRGEYSDGLDRSPSVAGTYTLPAFTVDVDFGDGHLHFAGTVVNARTATGNMWTSALGNRLYPFTMTR
jgi:hypothetical protein